MGHQRGSDKLQGFPARVQDQLPEYNMPNLADLNLAFSDALRLLTPHRLYGEDYPGVASIAFSHPHPQITIRTFSRSSRTTYGRNASVIQAPLAKSSIVKRLRRFVSKGLEVLHP